MKINSNTIDSWLKNLPSGLRFAVIYGQDLGQGKIVCDKIVKAISSNSEINVISLSFDDIKGNPSSLSDEMASLSLLGDRKIIVINDAPATLSKEFQEILKNPKGDAILIFLAEELKPTSNLRKLSESSEIGVSIACYKDDPRVLQTVIRSYLLENKVKFDQDVPSYLAEILPPNRLLIQNELNKLVIYSLNQNKPIEVDDIEQVVGDASELGLDELCIALVTKNREIMQKQISKMIAEEKSFVFVLRVLLRYVMRILEVYTSMEKSKTIEEGVGSLSPPVFFKQKDNLIRVIKTTPAPLVKGLLKRLLQLELDCKNTRVDPQTLVCNFLTQATL